MSAWLGAVVMPHNLFLHSEVIQSVHYEQQGEKVIRETPALRALLTRSLNGRWLAINSAAGDSGTRHSSRAARGGDPPRDRGGDALSTPGLGSDGHLAVALLLAGPRPPSTAGMAAGTISAGMSARSTTSMTATLRGRWRCMGIATLACLLVENTFQAWCSQALLSPANHDHANPPHGLEASRAATPTRASPTNCCWQLHRSYGDKRDISADRASEGPSPLPLSALPPRTTLGFGVFHTHEQRAAFGTGCRSSLPWGRPSLPSRCSSCRRFLPESHPGLPSR